jgi:NTP pyrophosphatase (non-canonical NTP hydrolase)
MLTNRWLLDYATSAKGSDMFRGRSDHVELLAAGLLGEAGSVLAEVKKRQREPGVYPEYLGSLHEELGDALWYFVRLIDAIDRGLLRQLSKEHTRATRRPALESALRLGAAAGTIISTIGSKATSASREALTAAWRALEQVANASRTSLREAAALNLAKTQSRWPLESTKRGWPRPSDYSDLFDTDEPREERLPRKLEIEFIEHRRGKRSQVVLRCNNINVGARINDNISDPDHYRYHDIFHLSYAVFLGWSPVIRSLLRCKRKSDPDIDENQDGARAGIIEEAISAVVFSRAKHAHYFEGARQVDYDLLKSIVEFIHGYEVEAVPVWQWERAILEGFRLFRLLKANHGGRISLNLADRSMLYRAPTKKRPRSRVGKP